MSRYVTSGLALAAVIGLCQTGTAANSPANGSAMPAPSSSSSPSMTPKTPEEMGRDAYNSGIEHKDKGLKYEADAEKNAKDRDKNLAKAKDEYGKALKDFKKALELVPGAHQAHNGMGFALRKTGDYAGALQSYDKALQLAPGFPDAIEYRGEAYLALGRVDDAKQAYLALFAKDRAQADQLMKAMTAWVSKHQADAAVDPGVVTSLDSWIKERAKLSSLTADMGLHNHQSIWK